MEAIILAGGKGTRLREVVSDRPKPLAAINGQPFLRLLLDSLANSPITRVVLAVGYLHEQIIDHFEENPPLIQVSYSIESKPLGTGGAVKHAAKKIHGTECLIFNGDSFSDVDIAHFLQSFPNSPAVIAYKKIVDARRYGSLTIDNSQTITSFAEKSNASPNISLGIYRMQLEPIVSFPKDSFSLETDIFPTLKGCKGVECTGKFIDIGTPQSYQKAQTYLTKELI